MKIMANRMDRGFFRYQKEFEDKALEVLRSGWYVLGNEVKSFEEEFAAYTGGNYCGPGQRPGRPVDRLPASGHRAGGRGHRPGEYVYRQRDGHYHQRGHADLRGAGRVLQYRCV